MFLYLSVFAYFISVSESVSATCRCATSGAWTAQSELTYPKRFVSALAGRIAGVAAERGL
jgi:hypothetical protein